jgi:hypothetical protein
MILPHVTLLESESRTKSKTFQTQIFEWQAIQATKGEIKEKM